MGWPYGVGPIEGTAGQPLPALEPGSIATAPEDAVAGGQQGAPVPETSGAAGSSAVAPRGKARAKKEPTFVLPARRGAPPARRRTHGLVHGELL